MKAAVIASIIVMGFTAPALSAPKAHPKAPTPPVKAAHVVTPPLAAVPQPAPTPSYDTPKLARMVQDYDDVMLKYLTDEANFWMVGSSASTSNVEQIQSQEAGDLEAAQIHKGEYKAFDAQEKTLADLTRADMNNAITLYHAILAAPGALQVYRTGHPYFPPAPRFGLERIGVDTDTRAANLCQILKR